MKIEEIRLLGMLFGDGAHGYFETIDEDGFRKPAIYVERKLDGDPEEWKVIIRRKLLDRWINTCEKTSHSEDSPAKIRKYRIEERDGEYLAEWQKTPGVWGILAECDSEAEAKMVIEKDRMANE